MKLICENLEIGYIKNQVLVSAIFLPLSKGNIIVIEGENGSGKTTLLKTLAGLLPSLGGKKMEISPEFIHYVNAETYSLFPYMTGKEILGFFECINNSKVCEEIKTNELFQNLLSKKYQDMSSGMKQVLKLALSLMDSKQIVLWDEPLKSLSEFNSREIVKIVSVLMKEKYLIITSHDQSFDDLAGVQKFRIENGRLKAK